MESTPSSGSEPLAPSTRRAAAVHAVRELSRSRRAQTFGLGALCGALALSLLVVVTTIFAVSQRPDMLPDDPVPVSEQRLPTPAPTTPAPSPTATPTPTVTPVDEADAAPDQPADPAPPAVEEPAPEPEPEVVATPTAPGNSGSAPGHNKKKP